MAEDAAAIINEAATKREKSSGISVGAPSAERNPFREIHVVEFEAPPCEQYPKGAILYIMPHQVQKHMMMYPGGRVLRDIKKVVPRGARPSGRRARGHVDPQTFLQGAKVEQ